MRAYANTIKTISPSDDILSRLKSGLYEDVLNIFDNEHERQQIRSWIESRIYSFEQSCEIIADEEFQLTLMWFYIQLKAEWSQLNTHNQYAQMFGRKIEKKIAAKLKVLSVIIIEIEKDINLLHVDGVTSFFSLPMRDFNLRAYYGY